MFLLIKRLVREYVKIFVYVYVGGLIMRVLVNILDDVDVFQAVNAIWLMLSATFLVVLSTYFLYEFLYTRHKYFYYTIKYSRLNIVIIMSIILTLLNFSYYLIYARLDYWNATQKLISLLTYFITASVLLYSCRRFVSKKIGFNIFLLTFVSFLIANSVVFYKVFSDEIGNKFMIGISSIADANNIYTNGIPITLFVEESIYTKLSYYSSGINVLFLIIFSLLTVTLRKIKINW